MLFVSINHPDFLQTLPGRINGVELRLDLFPKIDVGEIKSLLSRSTLPFLFTLRNSSHGGGFQGSEEEREGLIEQLLELQPPFFDLEYDMRNAFLQMILQKYRKTKFILSYHNFQETPLDLEKIFDSMSQYSVYGYKLAALAQTTLDALRMLLFSRQHPRVSTICMGEKGKFARVLGPISGNLIDYASHSDEEKTAPGQLSAHDLIHIYHYHTLNAKTALYGLIGDPVEHSWGHLYHNSIFANRRLNAVYVKMVVQPEELSHFFSLAKEIGFQGLSVTMPLKEKVISFLDLIDTKAKQMGAVNTLLLKKEGIFGLNTDAVGALDAIETRGSVNGKKIVLLGAGGAARAIAFEAMSRGAQVLILNRTIPKAKEISKEIGCQAGGLTDIPNDYQILVNCSSDPMPIDPEKISLFRLVMDLVYVPKETPFLLKAKEVGCKIIYGEEMFFNQAGAQIKLWTSK